MKYIRNGDVGNLDFFAKAFKNDIAIAIFGKVSFNVKRMSMQTFQGLIRDLFICTLFLIGSNQE